ncbi:hypothetical protein SESBI_37008 [Sesbania bispinosa]|nr:hypothetical protein SESBI_37008 [Sesbania bispinosa]
MHYEPCSAVDPCSKTPPRRVKGTGNVLPLAQRKVARESLKYTYVTWVRRILWSLGPIPDPPSEDEERPLEPRVWGWSSGLSRHSLLDIIDEEDQCVHRPYTNNFFPGVEGLHCLYQEGEFASRNVRSSRVEDVFDVWCLILCPQILPGFIITDTVSIAGSVFFPFSYRPDRLCCQFGLDQPPCHVDLEFCEVSVAMKVAYNARLKTAIKHYEQQNFMQNFPNIPIICKDPYYVTSSMKEKPRQETGTSRSMKRKSPKSSKESVTPPTISKGEAAPRKGPKLPILIHRLLLPPGGLLPALPRLKRCQCSLTPASDPGDDQNVQDSPSSSVARTATRGSFTAKASLEGDGNHSVSTRGFVPIGDGDDVQPSVVEDTVDDHLVAGNANTIEQLNSLRKTEAVPEPGGASPPMLDVFPAAPLPKPSKVVALNPIGAASIFSLGFSLAFLKPAYVVFADFLRFVRTHSIPDLLSVHKDKVAEELKALALFGFKGNWFDKITDHLNQTIPSVAFEDMEKLADAIAQQSRCNNELRT